MKRATPAISVLWVVGACLGADLPISSEGCAKDPIFYEGKYRLAENIEFRGGFSFLRSIRQIAPVNDPNLQKGALLNLQALSAFVKQLQDTLSAGSDERFHVSIVRVFLERCSPPEGASGELHVNVQVFDSSPSLSFFRQFESRQFEIADPISAARSGMSKTAVKFLPRAGFNSSDRIFGGGLLSATIPAGVIDTLTVEGTGSNTGSRANLDLTGERSWESGRLQSASWHLGFSRMDRPTGEVSLVGSALYGHFRLISQPLGASNTVLRFGSEIAGGNSQSDLEQSALPLNTLASASNQTWKNAVGVTTRIGVHSIAASYGVQMGRVGRGKTVDYHKHLADLAYSTYKLLGDHKLVEYETRLSTGILRTPGMVPAAERFFGGNRETGLFSGPEFSNDWRIRSNPFLRGISANRFNRVVPGPITGGEGFFAWNNTVTLPTPLVHYPLLPGRLVESPEFAQALKTARGANQSALTVSYTADDPASKEAVKKIPAVDATLDALRRIVDEIVKSGGAAQADAKACSAIIRNQRAVLEEAAEAMEMVVAEDDDSAVIPSVLACVGKVRVQQPDSRFEPLVDALNKLSQQIRALLDKIDRKKVEKLVNRDMALSDRAMNVFFKEASILTVNPVVVLDVARLSGDFQSAGRLGVRYSIGGGLRLQILRVMNLTGGYALNPRRAFGEKAGAFFFALDVLDLFR